MADAAIQAGDADCWATSPTSGFPWSINFHHSTLLLLPQWQWIRYFVFYIFCHTCCLCHVELVAQFSREGINSSVVIPCSFCVMAGHFHIVNLHPMFSFYIHMFAVLQAFMVGLASQSGAADSSWAPSLTSGFHGSMNVLFIACALMTVH